MDDGVGSERTFEIIGNSCIRCSRPCGNLEWMDKHDVPILLKINGKPKLVTVCKNPQVSPRGEISDPPFSYFTIDDIKKCRVCLWKSSGVSKEDKVEVL